MLNIISMLLPIPFIIIGLIFSLYKVPFNDVIGYRTKKSKKSKEAWDFANKLTGKMYLFLGIFTLLLTIGMIFFTSLDEETIMLVLMPIIIIISLVPIPIIEYKLKRDF